MMDGAWQVILLGVGEMMRTMFVLKGREGRGRYEG